jgi:outer membrane immunogenic protein
MFRMLSKVLVGLAISLTFVAAASAQTSWTGLYFGGNIGDTLGRSTANTSTVFSATGYFATTSVPAIGTTGRQSLSPNGITAGGQGGMNFQSGSLVFGGEADFGIMHLSESATGTTTYPCCSPTAFTITQSIDTDWLFTARGRGGYSMGNALIYATGGLALTKLDYQAQFTDTFATANETGGADKSKTGWAGGGGIEYKMGGRLSVKGEYLYADFGRVTATSTNLTAFTPTQTFPTNVFTHTAAMHAHIFRGGVNYRW